MRENSIENLCRLILDRNRINRLRRKYMTRRSQIKTEWIKFGEIWESDTVVHPLIQNRLVDESQKPKYDELTRLIKHHSACLRVRMRRIKRIKKALGLSLKWDDAWNVIEVHDPRKNAKVLKMERQWRAAERAGIVEKYLPKIGGQMWRPRTETYQNWLEKMNEARVDTKILDKKGVEQVVIDHTLLRSKR